MKWFKHISDSGNDPDIDDSFTKFRSDGPYVFWTTLEIMSKEFDVEKPGENIFSVDFLKRRYRLRWDRVLLILRFFDRCGRIKVDLLKRTENDMIRLRCSKLKDLSDDYTTKIIRSNSGQGTD